MFEELLELLQGAGVEIRVEAFQNPPDSAGGLCVMRGRHLVLLDSQASQPEQSRALLEVLERIGLERMGLKGSDLSPPLLAKLSRRGQMPWSPPANRMAPHPSPHSPPPLRLVHYSPTLSDLTTMGVGGPATEFVEAHDEKEVFSTLKRCRDTKTALYVLGGGSNVVVADAGIPGTVLQLRTRGISIEDQGEFVLVEAQAGEVWHDFASQMTLSGYGGLECLGGIPGAVGATPIQNVGAYGQEVSQTISAVKTVDRRTLKTRVFSPDECEFAYRSSVFKTSEKDNHVVLSVTYRLLKSGAPMIRYGELSKELERRHGSEQPSLEHVFRAVIDLRKAKSMVLDPDDENARSCGSFFVNALISEEQVAHISEIAEEAIPTFPGESGLVKVPAAWLIERAGFPKGTRRGHVGLSTKHTLALVAHRGASAHELVQFANHIRTIVEEHFGVLLQPEPHFWGFEKLNRGLPTPALPRGIPQK